MKITLDILNMILLFIAGIFCLVSFFPLLFISLFISDFKKSQKAIEIPFLPFKKLIIFFKWQDRIF